MHATKHIVHWTVSFSFKTQKHRQYLFVQSVPREPTSGKKGKLMVAFTHHEATCSAVNMCCYLTYYMTGMSAFFPQPQHALRPTDSHFHITVDVCTGCGCVLQRETSLLHVFIASSNSRCISYIIHLPFYIVLFYLLKSFFNMVSIRKHRKLS